MKKDKSLPIGWPWMPEWVRTVFRGVTWLFFFVITLFFILKSLLIRRDEDVSGGFHKTG